MLFLEGVPGIGVNRKLKDSVFSLLFSDPDILRSLYGALEGVELAPDVPISINTLSDVLFKDQINDLSFTVDKRLVVLTEHQSTVNPNMPIRLLKYIAWVYDDIVVTKKTYAKKLVPIPWPEFFVLYNGKEDCPDKVTLKLSDAFMDSRPAGLELIVTVYNINPGHNGGMLKKCAELDGYSFFMDRIREYRKTIADKMLAVKKAIDDCKKRNILREFLEKYSTEVLDMLLTEWKTEEYAEAQREEGREEGEKKKALEDARNFLALGVSPATVAKASGLDLETVKALSEAERRV